MKIISFIAVLLMFASTILGQPTLRQKSLTRHLEKDLAFLLPIGNLSVDHLDKIVMSSRRQELYNKFLLAMKANPEWFLQNANHAVTGYDKRLGMSLEEWKEFQQMEQTMSDFSIESSGKVALGISFQNDQYHFQSAGKISILNTMILDAKRNHVQIQGHTLLPKDTISVTSKNNIFKDSWRGYGWNFAERSSLAMPSTQEELSRYSSKVYSVTIGFFESTAQAFLEISATEIQNGQKTLSEHITLLYSLQ